MSGNKPDLTLSRPLHSRSEAGSLGLPTPVTEHSNSSPLSNINGHESLLTQGSASPDAQELNSAPPRDLRQVPQPASQSFPSALTTGLGGVSPFPVDLHPVKEWPNLIRRFTPDIFIRPGTGFLQNEHGKMFFYVIRPPPNTPLPAVVSEIQVPIANGRPLRLVRVHMPAEVNKLVKHWLEVKSARRNQAQALRAGPNITDFWSNFGPYGYNQSSASNNFALNYNPDSSIATMGMNAQNLASVPYPTVDPRALELPFNSNGTGLDNFDLNMGTLSLPEFSGTPQVPLPGALSDMSNAGPSSYMGLPAHMSQAQFHQPYGLAQQQQYLCGNSGGARGEGFSTMGQGVWNGGYQFGGAMQGGPSSQV